ncbi:hypothetical protein AAMO2058_000828600 [Amorphochlora amoebiformis]
MDDIEEIRRQHAKAEAQFLEVLDRWGIPKYIDPDGQEAAEIDEAFQKSLVSRNFPKRYYKDVRISSAIKHPLHCNPNSNISIVRNSNTPRIQNFPTPPIHPQSNTPSRTTEHPGKTFRGGATPQAQPKLPENRGSTECPITLNQDSETAPKTPPAPGSQAPLMPKSVLASLSKTRKSKKMRESIGKAGDGVRPSLRIESQREKSTRRSSSLYLLTTFEPKPPPPTRQLTRKRGKKRSDGTGGRKGQSAQTNGQDVGTKILEPRRRKTRRGNVEKGRRAGKGRKREHSTSIKTPSSLKGTQRRRTQTKGKNTFKPRKQRELNKYEIAAMKPSLRSPMPLHHSTFGDADLSILDIGLQVEELSSRSDDWS